MVLAQRSCWRAAAGLNVCVCVCVCVRARAMSQARMIDAPVSGGVGGAEAGTLTFMVGGSAEDFAAAQGVLKKMGKNIVHCGGSGTGADAAAARARVVRVRQPARAPLRRPGGEAVQQPHPWHHNDRRVGGARRAPIAALMN